MSLSKIVALAVYVAAVAAQAPTETYPATPLASKGPYTYPSGIPYKVDTDTHLIRGVQHGYNICNSTTAGQDSLCQTMHVNSVDDFCLWGPPEMGREVGDIEGIMVAWCTQPRHGTRLIPAEALHGVQFMKTPDYAQVVGFIDQTKINILAGDYGGEMDPHGADLRGNPMGGLVFSNQFTGSPIQAIEWHNFMGNNGFCIKVCDPNGPDAANFCEHKLDRIGCAYNAPNNARNGTFESCEGESQDFPGIHTNAAGVTTSYNQPAGPITSISYTARVPASSNCRQFESTSIYSALPTLTPTGVTTTSTTSGRVVTSAPTSRPATTGNAPGSGSGSTPTPTPGAGNTGGASALSISFGAVAASVFAALFFA
ncbi:hypothetical protein CVT24_002790 [Panaeolus cyanescens]|uniref:Mannoprotein n=1 Tax=Panaeolus cyanescens TaxID=181874 RepID=A0A409YRG2_9AGAR|nr:hypothetical protein CVT24_002790 [Panaeolus cyanescens]